MKGGPAKEGPVMHALQCSLEQNGLLKPGKVLLAAVSGGSDSMALLSGLHAFQQETGFTLHALHVQHGLRGEDSLADEQLVRNFCAQHDIPLTVHQADLGGDLHQPGMETRARDCRRGFFAAEMERLHADALLLAHHRDDQTETVLMHLLRGAGGNGLAGMRPAAPFAGGQLLRPFLQLSKDELRNVCRLWKVPYREDASNQQDITLRNALRLRVLPLLEELSPGCSGRIARTARLLQQDESCLNRLAVQGMKGRMLSAEGLHALPLEALAGMDEALALRALRLWYAGGLRRMGIDPEERWLSAADSEALLAFVLLGEPSGRMNLPCGLQAFRGSRWLHLLRQDGSSLIPAPVPEPVTLLSLLRQMKPDGTPVMAPPEEAAALSASGTDWEGTLLVPDEPLPRSRYMLICSLCVITPDQPPESALTAYVPLELADRCVFRTPRPGDIIRPLGAPGTKPLRRFLTDRKIDPPFRDRLPLLAMGSGILWIPGLCTAAELTYRPGQRVICIRAAEAPPYLHHNTCKGD